MLLNVKFRKYRFMKFPAVDATDAVNAGSLPPELVGKTPAEIATYYADRESTILENARNMVNEARAGANNNPPPTNTPPPNTPPTDPKFVTQDQLNNLTASAQAGLIYVAQQQASIGKPDWSRLLPEIKKIVEKLEPGLQIQADIWAETYYNVRGRMTDTLVTEARNTALGLEPPSPPITAPPKERTFTSDELSVIEGCGITPAMYVDADDKLTKGYQPFTTDNRRGKV
jgi:hypothetical protein